MQNGKNSNENTKRNNTTQNEPLRKETVRVEQNNEKIAAECRICVISIIVSDLSVAEQINAALSAYGEYIIGRMGVPYKQKNVSVISVALDAPVEVTNALTGKIGKLSGVYVKALFGKI